MPLTVGKIINNRYRVVKLLGQGGFGAVYRAWDVNLNIPVAVKENTETSPDAARQFEREAKILAALRHPNLPKVTDYFVLPDLGQYLVMEFIDGEDLNQKLENNGAPLPTGLVLEWADQILSALRYLHGQNPPIIHRDIKPQNIRVTPDGQAMLVDFGIAKLADQTKKTTVGARAITPGYSPHEQYGQGATDERSDIYALGATLYALLTAETPPESVARFSEDILVSPREYNPDLPEPVVRALLRALEMDPRKRWQNAEEFRLALKGSDPAPEEVHIAVQRNAVPATVVVSAAPSKPLPRQVAVEKAKDNSVLIGVGIGAAVFLLIAIFAAFAFRIFSGGGEKTPTAAAVIAAPTATSLPTAVKIVEPGGPIKIGLLAPLSGQVPTFGISVREGVEMAVKEWNARGGVLGRPIELIVADSQCSADPAVNAANKLIDQDGVKYIVGEVCSSASIPVTEITNPRKIVQISPTSTNTLVTVDNNGVTRPYTFRSCFIDPFQGLVMARFAYGRGFGTAFILYDQGNDYVRGLAEAFEKAFTGMGGRIVGKETYVGSVTNFSAALNKVADSKAEVLYLPDYYNIVNLVGAQAKDKGITAVMMGGDGWDSADLDVAAAEGGFYSNHYDPGDTRQIVLDWLKKYGEAYKNEQGEPKVPDALATLGYDAANLLIAAIEKAGEDDTTKVAEALAGLTWEGVTGRITFDAKHNPIKAAAVIGVANGQKTFVESVAP